MGVARCPGIALRPCWLHVTSCIHTMLLVAAWSALGNSPEWQAQGTHVECIRIHAIKQALLIVNWVMRRGIFLYEGRE